MRILLSIFFLFSSYANAKLLFDEKPTLQDELTLLKITTKNKGWGFKDWDEMKKDPDIGVEDFRAFIGARCGGLYQARIEVFRNYEDDANINSRLNSMNDLIDNYSLDIYTEIVSEDAQSWNYFRKHMYKYYYIELYDFSKKYDFKLESLSQDSEICESEYEKYS